MSVDQLLEGQARKELIQVRLSLPDGVDTAGQMWAHLPAVPREGDYLGLTFPDGDGLFRVATVMWDLHRREGERYQLTIVSVKLERVP